MITAWELFRGSLVLILIGTPRTISCNRAGLPITVLQDRNNND